MTTAIRPIGLLIATALFATFAPAQLWAGGFNTAPADPVFNFGPESAWMNPAGMTGVKTPAVTAGFGVALPVMKFDPSVAGAGGDDGGNAGIAGGSPTVFAVVPIGEDFRLGFSLLSPFGAATGAGVDYGREFVGRYAATEAEISSLAFGPSVAYQVTDDFSIGVGAVAMYTSFDQKIALDTPGADGQFHLDELDGWSGLFYGGLLYQITQQTSVGVVYRSESNVDVSGDGVFSGLPVTLPVLDLELEWNTPQSVQVGVQHAFSPSWIVGLDFAWEDWSVFSENRVSASFSGGVGISTTIDRNWMDSYAGEISVTHIDGQNVYNVGLTYVTSVVDDEDRTIDLPLDDSFVVSLAAARNESENLTYGIGGAIIFNGNAEVDQTAQGTRFAGEFDTNIIFVIGASLQWRF